MMTIFEEEEVSDVFPKYFLFTYVEFLSDYTVCFRNKLFTKINAGKNGWNVKLV